MFIYIIYNMFIYKHVYITKVITKVFFKGINNRGNKTTSVKQAL